MGSGGGKSGARFDKSGEGSAGSGGGRKSTGSGGSELSLPLVAMPSRAKGPNFWCPPIAWWARLRGGKSLFMNLDLHRCMKWGGSLHLTTSIQPQKVCSLCPLVSNQKGIPFAFSEILLSFSEIDGPNSNILEGKTQLQLQTATKLAKFRT